MGPAVTAVKAKRRAWAPAGAIIVRMRFLPLRFGARGLLAVALFAIAAVNPASAMPPTATRVELARWFESLQRERKADLGAPQTWTFTFVGTTTRSLETLWRELVRDDYKLVSLGEGAAPTLRVTRVELHSPVSLVQRNHELQLLANKHGARYTSFDVIRAQP